MTYANLQLKIISILFIAIPYSGNSQDIYQVGAAKVSIEPGRAAFSLALAGYGIPAAGRFTLEWIDKGNANSNPVLWKQVFRHQRRSEQAAKFGLKKEDFPKGMISMASHNNRLYVLTEANRLFKYQPENLDLPWLPIARQNGLTYKQDIREIIVVKDRLYGIGKDDHIYLAEHCSENDLSVTALAVKKEKETAVVIGMDLCGINSSFTGPLKAYIFKKLRIPPSAILINASHTHFAPVVQDWSTWSEPMQHPDTSYLNTVVKRAIIDAITISLKNLKPSRLSFGRTKTNIGLNRSLKGENIPYDNDVDVVIAQDKGNSERELIFMTGCHPTYNNEGIEDVTISPNYPGTARNILEKNGISYAVFLQGCGGDINPKDDKHTKTGEILAADVMNILGREMKPLSGEISHYLDTLNIPVKRMPKADIIAFRAANSGKAGNVFAEKNVRWANKMLKYDAEDKMPSVMPVYIQTINIGNWKLVGLSREAVTDYSIGIKQLWPDKLVSVAGYCNDVSSYLPTSKHINAGTYEGNESFFWYGQPSVFPVTIYETILNRIKDQNR